ncbi:MAG: isopenicillin N synthase family dioxygenase [Lautropia sp.]
MSDRVPVIDIRRLDSPAARAAIDRACRDWGFFQVTGHGIERSVIDEVFAVSQLFFAQPAADKRRILRDADNPWGYFDRELTKNRRDCKEIYDFGPDSGDGRGPRWPGGRLRQRFEPAVRACHASCTTLSLRLLSVIASNLGANPQVLARGFEQGTHTSFVRLNFYPKSAPDDAGDAARQPLGVGEHTDAGALTILLQDEQPGLAVQRRDGRWHLVAPQRDALVVNIGDIVQVWSNDQYRTAPHRVLTNPAHDRYSIPFFLNPSYETTYEPLPAMVTPDRPAVYRRIGWREFRGLRAAGDYADLGEEVQIRHYRR